MAGKGLPQSEQYALERPAGAPHEGQNLEADKSSSPPLTGRCFLNLRLCWPHGEARTTTVSDATKGPAAPKPAAPTRPAPIAVPTRDPGSRLNDETCSLPRRGSLGRFHAWARSGDAPALS